MEGSEELREALVALRREVGTLRVENMHANLLIEALDAVLRVEDGNDPFDGVFEALLPIFHASHAIVLIEPDDDSGRLDCVASNATAIIGTVWENQRTLRKVLSGRTITKVAGALSESWPESVALSSEQPALYLPLRVSGRRGLLLLLRAIGTPAFDRSHIDLARKFSLLASHAFAAKRASQTEAEKHRLTHLTRELEASQQALTHRANHDELTGLANRAHVQELVDQRLRRHPPGARLALAFLDMDNFKDVNDFYGHSAGDELLKRVAARLRAQIRQDDILGRISGDEFVIALESFGAKEDTLAIIERVSKHMSAPFEIEGRQIKTSGSIGVALWPDHGRDYETLRRHADTAMYQSKTGTKGGVAMFSTALGRRAAKRLSLEHRLREALTHREFQCALQHKVELSTHRVVGFEALVRWVDREGVVHAPGQFLAVASALGLLDEIARMILSSLIEALPRLDGVAGSDTTISLNISAEQATNVVFMENYIESILGSGCPGRFLLELTEESFLATDLFQSRILPLIREAGIGVSIDDFGTGYSSLGNLADLTADELKVDRSLITCVHERPRSQGILRAIESLGASLGMSVVAEGIENEAERIYLLGHSSIRTGQGFLHHRPQLLSELIASSSIPPAGRKQAG